MDIVTSIPADFFKSRVTKSEMLITRSEGGEDLRQDRVGVFMDRYLHAL